MKMNGMSKVATACCSLLILAGGMPVHAQGDAAKASMADKKFVTEALQGGMAEVQLGHLATQKGKSDDVKRFGQKMVEDHSRMGTEMKGVASQIGVADPGMVTAQDKALMERLERLSGDAFDRAYIQAMVKDHKMDLMEFKKEASSGMAAPVKEEASKGSEVISQHLQMIEQIAQAHHFAAGPASSM